MSFAFRGLYRIYRTGSRVWCWAQRRFTTAGLAVMGALGLTAIVGIDTEHNLDYQAFMILFSLLLVALCFAWSFRARFSARRLLPRFGSVGTPLAYTVAITNHSKRRQVGLTLLDTLVDPIPSYAEWFAAQMRDLKTMRSFRIQQRQRTVPFRVPRVRGAEIPGIPPEHETTVTLEVLPARRGLLRFERLLVARPDPLGLFRSLVRIPLRQNVLVLPKRYRLPPLALPGTMKYQEGGVAMASNVGQSEEFVALRDYRSGDPMRHIHWRSWARVGKPVVKEFEDEFFVRHALVLDTFSASEHSEVFEEAVSVAASFACTIQTQESLLDLLFIGPESYCFTSGRGLAHTDQMLEILASVSICRDQQFSSLESLVLQQAKNLSGAICIFIAWDEARQEFVRKLKSLGVPLMVMVVIPTGAEKPLPGPMSDEPGAFYTLEVGNLERDLSALSQRD